MIKTARHLENNKKLAIIGGYPPPYGGVSTHVMRLRAQLENTSLNWVIYNTVSQSEEEDHVHSVVHYRWLWMLWYTFFGKESCVYLVSARTLNWFSGAFMQKCRGKSVAIRLQNAKIIEDIHKGGFRKWLIGFALRSVTAIVCVNRELASALQSIGVDSHKIKLFYGFLPPSFTERDAKQVPPEVWNFCKTKSPLIAANGKVQFWKGEDLYGLDHLVCLAERLKPEFPNVGIVVCFWDHLPEDQPVLDKLITDARAKGVDKNIFFNTKKGFFVPVIEKADLFVRPTNTDGDANSIREAQYFGVPVVASDVVERPEGTILFRTRDIEDFTNKTRTALNETVQRSSKPLPEIQENANERLHSYLVFLANLSQQEIHFKYSDR